MEKNQKMWLIGGGIAALGVLVYELVSQKNTSNLSNSSTIGPNGTCPSGQVPCGNNPMKCYNPSANYIVDPCASASSNTKKINNPIATPIAQIVDGIIGLFKKNNG
jgi:hypothetical protein